MTPFKHKSNNEINHISRLFKPIPYDSAKVHNPSAWITFIAIHYSIQYSLSAVAPLINNICINTFVEVLHQNLLLIISLALQFRPVLEQRKLYILIILD